MQKIRYFVQFCYAKTSGAYCQNSFDSAEKIHKWHFAVMHSDRLPATVLAFLSYVNVSSSHSMSVPLMLCIFGNVKNTCVVLVQLVVDNFVSISVPIVTSENEWTGNCCQAGDISRNYRRWGITTSRCMWTVKIKPFTDPAVPRTVSTSSGSNFII